MEFSKVTTLHPTPAHKVFTIAELLESILLLLPPQELFLLQRVSSVFRDTITRSNAIRRALWLRGSPAACDITSSEALDTNPILAVHIKTLYDRIFELDGRCYSFLRFDSSDPLKRLGWRGPTLVQHLFVVEHYLLYEEVIPTICPVGYVNDALDGIYTADLENAAGTWLDMYISRPINDVNISLWEEHTFHDRYHRNMGIFTIKGGTLREMIERMNELRRESEEAREVASEVEVGQMILDREAWRDISSSKPLEFAT